MGPLFPARLNGPFRRTAFLVLLITAFVLANHLAATTEVGSTPTVAAACRGLLVISVPSRLGHRDQVCFGFAARVSEGQPDGSEGQAEVPRGRTISRSRQR